MHLDRQVEVAQLGTPILGDHRVARLDVPVGHRWASLVQRLQQDGGMYTWVCGPLCKNENTNTT